MYKKRKNKQIPSIVFLWLNSCIKGVNGENGGGEMDGGSFVNRISEEHSSEKI